jgi:hypothetical protein
VAQNAPTTDPSDQRTNFQLGIKAGINYSNLYDEQGQNLYATSLLGFAGGAFLSIPIGTYLGVQPEVLYSQKGYTGTGGTGVGEIGQFSYTDRLDFLDISLYFSLLFRSNYKIKFKTQEGAAIMGFKLPYNL